MHHVNAIPDPVFRTLEDLRCEMTRLNPSGAAFLDYLLDGEYSEGKGIWINGREQVKTFYDKLVANSPELLSECPYGPGFRTDGIRVRGDNRVTLLRVADSPPDHQREIQKHLDSRRRGGSPPVSVFAGGPAAKIAAIIAASKAEMASGVHFILDGAEQSNESGSASYEHVNHANALNAEHDNTGFGILGSAIRRALRGEPDATVALDYDYRKVDLWPSGIRLGDLPIYAGNELHGWLQRLKAYAGVQTDHTKSRLASLSSTHILSHIEHLHDCSLRLENSVKRAIFLYFTEKNYRLSREDNSELRASVGLKPENLSTAKLVSFYGELITSRVYAGFAEKSWRGLALGICTAKELNISILRPRKMISDGFLFGACQLKTSPLGT
jgi:hypothetical protein